MPDPLDAPAPLRGDPLNVRLFGARGDGAADDTAAFRNALEALPEGGGALFVPPGTYRTDLLEPPDFTTLFGRTAWSFYPTGTTTLVPLRAEQPCIVDTRERKGVRLCGLAFDGTKAGDAMHGWINGTVARTARGEQHNVAEDCKFVDFTGCGACFEKAWVWAVRRCQFMHNGVDGLNAADSYDAWVVDTMFSGNGRDGARLSAATTVTACRVEWNRHAGFLLGPEYVDSVQVSNCLFDHNFGPGVEIDARQVAVAVSLTGNVFRRNGCEQPPDSPRNSQALLRRARGLAMTGNTFLAGATASVKDDPPTDACAVHGLVLEGLRDSVIEGNALYHGAMRRLIRDEGGHANLVLDRNPGSLYNA